MRTSVPCIVLALAARSAAYPVAPGLHIRADAESTGKPRYPIVNVDGPDGDSDSPRTVTVTRHSAPTTVTQRVTDTVVYTTHKPTTIISIVPVDGKPGQENEQDESKAPSPTPVTITIWESSAAAPSLPPTPSTPTTLVLTSPTPTTRPAVVDPEPEPTTDFITPPSSTSSQAAGESSTELSSVSSGAPESGLPSWSPSLPPAPAPTTSIAGDGAESSTATPQSSAPAEPIEPQPSASTTELESFTASASVPAASSSTAASWDESSQSVSVEATSTPSVVVSPPDVITLWPPVLESPTASTPELSASPVPTTFVWASSITSAPAPESTSVHTNDDGYWHSSKYPSWNSTAPYTP